MRIHTSLTADQIREIVAAIPSSPRHNANPTLEVDIRTHRSRSHDYGHEVILTTADKREGEKRRQQSAYGTPYRDGRWGGSYAEYGWMIESIYREDRSGGYYTPKVANYADWTDFSERTAYAFDPMMAHLRMPVAYIQAGDVLVGDNIPGSGVKPVLSITKTPGERTANVRYSWIGGVGTYWESDQKMTLKRIVTVAREVQL